MRTLVPAHKAGAVRGAGFWSTISTVTLAFLILTEQTVNDPGGVEALMLVAAWLFPLVALATLAVVWPEVATPILLAALLVPLGLASWGAMDLQHWADLRAEVGPFDAVAVTFLGAAFAFLGRRPALTTTAGLSMVVLTAVPAALMIVVGGSVPAATVLVSLPILLAGLLYVWAGHLQHVEQPLTQEHVQHRHPVLLG